MSHEADAALGRLMLAFDGLELPEPMRRRLRSAPAAGVTLFRYRNVGSAEQVRELTKAIQACAPAPDLPFLIAADQEGGQLRGLGLDSTPFPGNMALGAVDDPSLTRRIGVATGTELRSVGVNVDYAPVADLATNPMNPSLGVRSFGDDPNRVARHVAAMVEGLESAGVAATLKHFPGKGDVGVDTHHERARILRGVPDLETRELVPFVAGLEAGASLVMSAHVAIPALTGDALATLSPEVLRGLLRERFGYGGVTISDAFDMDALAPGADRYADAIRGLGAGLDLLLLGGRSDVAAFDVAIASAALPAEETAASLDRIHALRRRLGSAPVVDPAAIGSAEHRELARDAARRAVTLVRDRDALLPLRVAEDERILVVVPRPVDLTPADTSAAETITLAAAVRRRHSRTDEIVVAPTPDPGEVAAVAERAKSAGAVVVGTVSASLAPAQAALVTAIVATGRPTLTVALRTPWDLEAYPTAGTHLCTYSVVDPSCDAAAAAIFGELRPVGRRPVSG